ncbi:hypothetical protein K2Q02_01450 [Patescibacteria group bacterium]|nr:hypothetical protein [Patescibacteria group bacterium]
MNILPHIAIFAAAIAAIWFFAGLIVESIDRVASKFNNSSFVVAFFLLGSLTSLGEISVAINSVMSGVPQVAAGNLVGASFVLLLFIVPLLAVAAGKITMHKILDGWRLVYVLFVIALPSLFLIDGVLSSREGVASLLFLVSLFWIIKKYDVPASTEKILIKENKRLPLLDLGKVLVAAVVIYFAGHLLVEEAVYFADVFNTPKSLMGVILLSIGTNIPEIAIALRAVLKHRADVALGNYLGSATMNTVIFAVLALVSKRVTVNQPEFVVSFVFTLVGFVLFYFFIRSKERLSRKEGAILLGLYMLFLAVHIVMIVGSVQ